MSFVRTIFAALLLLGWIPATNVCSLAALLPEQVEDCCTDDFGEPKEVACDRCATLETGIRLDLQALTVPAPVMRESAWDEDLCRLLSAAATADAQPVAWSASSPPKGLVLWEFVARTALPVRGPSLA